MRRQAATAAVLGAFLVGSIFGPADPAAAEGEVTIEKLVNGELADTAPGPTVVSGSTVTYRYLITVVTNQTLYDFTVTDTGGATPNCDINGDGQPDGYNAHPGPLKAGNSFICTASQPAGAPGITHASLGRVTAYNFDVSASFSAEDPGHYTASPPPTTAAPTTAAPTTAAPTTAAPTTAAPTTAAPTTAAPTSSAETTATQATDPTTSDASNSSEPPATELARADGDASPATAIDWNLTTPHPTVGSPDQAADRSDASDASQGLDETDLGPPGDLAAVSAEDEGGLSLWWSLILAFAAGGAVAFAVSRLTGPETTQSRADGPGLE